MTLLMTLLMTVASTATALSAGEEIKAPVTESEKYVFGGERFSRYKDFERDWKLVTVRFRKDTNEMRFVYANPAAWRHLRARSEGTTTAPYPDGAVFAKTGIATGEDTAFPSSVVPKGARRFQLMVRNSKKYADTNGWGYALFNEEWKQSPGDTKQVVQACAACHNIVPDRAYVFSELMAGLGSKALKLRPSESAAWAFVTTKIAELPKHIQVQIPVGVEEVRVLSGPLQQHVFPGTLDEIRPLLTKEARESKRPAILIGAEKNRFSLVYAGSLSAAQSKKPVQGCRSGEVTFVAIVGGAEQENENRVISFCD